MTTDDRLRALERRAQATGDPVDRAAWQAERIRTGQAPRVGLVFLEELWWRHDHGTGKTWRDHRGGQGPFLPPTVFPPPVLVVVAEWADLLRDCAAWLRTAPRCVVTATPSVAQARDELPDALWLEGVTPAAIDHALAQACALEAGAEWRWLPCQVSPGPASGGGARGGPWLEVTWDPRQGTSELAPRVGAPGGHPALVEPARGVRIDLVTGVTEVVAGLTPVDLYSWDRAGTVPRQQQRVAPTVAGFGPPISVDPWGRVTWTGVRRNFTWCVPTKEGLALWCTNSQVPRGHAKRAGSGRSNEPLWVQLAPDGSTCLSVYDHDALLAAGLPVRWRSLGEVALAERTGSVVLFFQASGVGDPAQAYEEARGRRATITLGPSAETRYCVGLEAPTYRYFDDRGTLLGGPANEWVVYDDAHRERQRHPGRLLGGWDRWVVVLEGEALVRLDLLTGERTPVGAPGRPFSDAISIAGTPHVLLVQAPEASDATTAWVRVV